MNYALLTDLPGEIARQRAWIDTCGGTLGGYVANYGRERGRAIYQADTAALAAMEAALDERRTP
jgi:hypothetical protein